MATRSPQPEAIRNRLLRRADWRFLLPRPNPERSLCFAEGVLAEAVREISRETVDPRRERPSGDFDLAVAVDPDLRTLRSAWAALRPGSACYTEWRSVLAGGPGDVRARLESAGFTDVTCYWPRSSTTAPGIWLPLEAAGPLQHFLTNRPPPGSLVRRLGRRVRRSRWLLNPRFRLTLPICAVARKPGAAGRAVDRTPPSAAARAGNAGGASDEGLGDILRAEWERSGLGPRPDRLSWLLVTDGSRSESKVVGLVFAEPDPTPRLAVKMSRIPEAVPGLRREVEALRALQGRPGGLAGAPSVLFARPVASGLAVGETVATGVPLSSLLTRASHRRLALKGTEWLGELAGRVEPAPPAAWRGRLVEAALRDFEASFGVVVDRVMLRETADVVRGLGALPSVCEHRDFAPWNLRMTATGDLAVVDWESSELAGLPAMDLVYFQVYLAAALLGRPGTGGLVDGYREMLDPANATGGVAEECFRRYAERVGMGLTPLRALRLLVWLIHSRSDYRHFVADAGGPPPPALLRRSQFVALWREELQRGGRG